MSENSIQIDKDLVGILDKVESKVRKRALRTGMRSAMKVVLAKAKQLVPVDSGALKRSLTIRSAKRSRSSVGIMVTTKEGLFSGETFYGGFKEYGHRLGKRTSNEDMGVRKRKRRSISERTRATALDDSRPMVKAQPFLRPALDGSKNAITAVMTAEIKRSLSERLA